MAQLADVIAAPGRDGAFDAVVAGVIEGTQSGGETGRFLNPVEDEGFGDDDEGSGVGVGGCPARVSPQAVLATVCSKKLAPGVKCTHCRSPGVCLYHCRSIEHTMSRDQGLAPRHGMSTAPEATQLQGNRPLRAHVQAPHLHNCAHSSACDVLRATWERSVAQDPQGERTLCCQRWLQTTPREHD